MTAFNFYTSRDSVVLYTDTLAIMRESHKPSHFTSKIFPLAHLRGCLVGTGTHQLAMNWYQYLLSSMLIRDLLYLDRFVTVQLRRLWKDVASNINGELGTSTIYHFGYSESERTFVSFAYRSAKDFASERLGFGLGVKPQTKVEDLSEAFSKPEDLDKLMISIIERQREEDLAKPIEEQIGIGGEIQKAILWPSAMSIETIYRFPDYDNQYEQMMENVRREE